MRILLVPADSRPGNAGMPRALAAIAGHEVVLPPHETMGAIARPANRDALLRFIADEAPLADLIIVSIDALVHGGVEFGCDATLTQKESLDRLAQLADALAPHAPRAQLFSYITRNTYPAASSRIAEACRDFARYNSLRAHAPTDESRNERDALAKRIPDGWAENYDFARKRNHQIQMRVADLIINRGFARACFVTDESAAYGPGDAEEAELRSRAQAANCLFLPGDAEAAAMLTAAAILEEEGHFFKISVLLSDAPGMGRRPLRERHPFRETFHAHMRALGLMIEHGEPALELYLHPPAPNSCDLWLNPSPAQTLDLAQFVDLIEKSVAANRVAVLADCGHNNGADPQLMKDLSPKVLGRLSGFAARSTASNTLCAALAHCSMLALGIKTGKFNEDEAALWTHTRLLEDYLYQTIARGEFIKRCAAERVDRYHFGAHTVELNETLDARLHELAAECLPFKLSPFRASFPCARLHEIEIDWK
ncbi:MAG: DUF4127 family protein [Planctomycetes bacterium]|nr:DUF4127 family protein [Planctomycetota bacterium]